MNFVFTKWLRPTYAGQKYAIFALNSLNLHQAPVPLFPIVQGTKIHWHGKGHRQTFVKIKGQRQTFVKIKGHRQTFVKNK